MEWQHEGPAVVLYSGEWEHDQRHGKGHGRLVCTDWVPSKQTDSASIVMLDSITGLAVTNGVDDLELEGAAAAAVEATEEEGGGSAPNKVFGCSDCFKLVEGEYNGMFVRGAADGYCSFELSAPVAAPPHRSITKLRADSRPPAATIATQRGATIIGEGGKNGEERHGTIIKALPIVSPVLTAEAATTIKAAIIAMERAEEASGHLEKKRNAGRSRSRGVSVEGTGGDGFHLTQHDDFATIHSTYRGEWKAGCMDGFGNYLEVRVAADVHGEDVEYPTLEGSAQYQYRYHYDGTFERGMTYGNGEEFVTRYHPTQSAAGEEQRNACREHFKGSFEEGARDGHGILTAATAIPKAEDRRKGSDSAMQWGHKTGVIEFERVQWDALWAEPDWDEKVHLLAA
jgi:hypothetical protein